MTKSYRYGKQIPPRKSSSRTATGGSPKCWGVHRETRGHEVPKCEVWPWGWAVARHVVPVVNSLSASDPYLAVRFPAVLLYRCTFTASLRTRPVGGVSSRGTRFLYPIRETRTHRIHLAVLLSANFLRSSQHFRPLLITRYDVRENFLPILSCIQNIRIAERNESEFW